jgi:signal transduction histidine kinase
VVRHEKLVHPHSSRRVCSIRSRWHHLAASTAYNESRKRVHKPPSDPLTPGDEKLVGDLAAQAGLVLRNARLIEDLRASRRRLVTAQDEERRRLERNIHDGAQQQLVALTVKARLAEQMIERDPAKARDLVAQIGTETTGTLEDLRDLARGIYPPLLADKGLAAALAAERAGAREAAFIRDPSPS